MKKYQWRMVVWAVVVSLVACAQPKERQAEDSVLTQQKNGIEVNEDEEDTFRESMRIINIANTYT